MSVQAVSEAVAARGRARLENETLYAVIKTVSSSLDLDRVLRGIVDIATEATACHACFIYFLEDDRLVLRAASPRYSDSSTSSTSASTRGSPVGWRGRRRRSSFARTRCRTRG